MVDTLFQGLIKHYILDLLKKIARMWFTKFLALKYVTSRNIFNNAYYNGRKIPNILPSPEHIRTIEKTLPLYLIDKSILFVLIYIHIGVYQLLNGAIESKEPL